MTFDPTKPVQTRSGQSARIVNTPFDGKYGQTLLAVVGRGEYEECLSYFKSGARHSHKENEDDLINVLVKRSGYVGVAYTVGDNANHAHVGSLVKLPEEALAEVKTNISRWAVRDWKFTVVPVEWTEE